MRDVDQQTWEWLKRQRVECQSAKSNRKLYTYAWQTPRSHRNIQLERNRWWQQHWSWVLRYSWERRVTVKGLKTPLGIRMIKKQLLKRNFIWAQAKRRIAKEIANSCLLKRKIPKRVSAIIKELSNIGKKSSQEVWASLNRLHLGKMDILINIFIHLS